MAMFNQPRSNHKVGYIYGEGTLRGGVGWLAISEGKTNPQETHLRFSHWTFEVWKNRTSITLFCGFQLRYFFGERIRQNIIIGKHISKVTTHASLHTTNPNEWLTCSNIHASWKNNPLELEKWMNCMGIEKSKTAQCSGPWNFTFPEFSASTKWQEFETTPRLAGVKTYHQLNSEFMSVVNPEE